MSHLQVLMCAVIHSELWLFVDYLKPAHPDRRGRAPWYSTVLPVWPHLQAIPTNAERYDWVLASGVEGVHLLAPDTNNPRRFYAVLDTDRALWHER